jgi:hypothetical protein
MLSLDKIKPTRFSILIIIISTLQGHGPHFVFAGKYTCGEIQGELIYANEKLTVPDTCFRGFNASNCTIIEGYDKSPLCTNVCSQKKTIDSLHGQKMRKRRITKCGSVDNSFIDSIENFAMIDGKAFPSNVYGYEFRFRGKRYELDSTVVTCPLKRTACNYVGNILIDCAATNDNTYLAGYHVNVELKRSFRDRRTYPAIDDNLIDDEEYPQHWWGVKSCSAVAIEVFHPPDTIQESIKFYWTPENYVFSPYQLSYFVIVPIIFFFVFYVRYFATECVLCGKKNAFLNKNEICLLCRFYGVELPPPTILDRLKAEKAERQFNKTLNKDAYEDGRRAMCRTFGIHQLPPMTCRSLCYLTYECFECIIVRSKACGWYLITLFTCGRIVRRRRPKIHAIQVLGAPPNPTAGDMKTQHPQLEDCDRPGPLDIVSR